MIKMITLQLEKDDAEQLAKALSDYKKSFTKKGRKRIQKINTGTKLQEYKVS